MTFGSIVGQDTAIRLLRRAVATDRVHHALRFEGPDGVGKERTAFALAQALVCERRQEGESDGCGQCSACERAVRLGEDDPRVPLHPDVIVVERGLYPASTIGRSTEENRDISMDQIRAVVLRHLAFPPHEGRARVILVRRVEELSVNAANLLLKTLEEPPPRTTFVLLTAHGDELLDTIRSRTLLVRFGTLGRPAMTTVLERHGVTGAAADEAIAFAQGSVGAALGFARDPAAEARSELIEAAERAIASPDLGAAIAFAQAQGKDRDDLRARLEALAARIATRAKAAAERDPDEAARLAFQFDAVETAARAILQNGAPQLALETMIATMRAAR